MGVYVDDVLGSNRWRLWLKHSVHGLHWVHVWSLPVSATPNERSGGVPTECVMRSSPVKMMISDTGVWED